MSDTTTARTVPAGRSEYADYMRTDALLSLQRPSEGLLHRDERLFQCVHQSTELWLKQATFELDHATCLAQSDRLVAAARILGRVSACIDFATRQLAVLGTIAPVDFATFRPALGAGSGLESPGWTALREAAPRLLDAFISASTARGLSLEDVFLDGADNPIGLLADALLDVDAMVADWRQRHLTITVRTIGHGGTGTRGMPVASLGRLLDTRLFPGLWQARSSAVAALPFPPPSEST